MMFNQEQKERYIAERESEVILAENMLNRLFKSTEPMETSLDKDVSCFTTEEIRNYYKIRNIKSFNVIANLNSQLSNYTQWCLQQNLLADGINHYLEFTQDILNKCVNKTAMDSAMMSKEEVHNIVQQLKNPREQFAILLLYETGKTKGFVNIFNARMTDIDFVNKKMRMSDGRVVDVSGELIHAAAQSAEAKHLNTYATKERFDYDLYRKFAEDGYIYKETENVKDRYDETRRVHRLNMQIKKAFEIIGVPKWIKLNTFVECGILNDIKDASKKLNMDPEKFIKNAELRKGVEYQHNYKIFAASYIRKYGEYLG